MSAMMKLFRKRDFAQRDQQSSLFRLPAELRLKIYGYLCLAFLPSSPSSIYRGLYQSCKLIKKEMDYECVKAAAPFMLELNVQVWAQPYGFLIDVKWPNREAFKELKDFQEIVVSLPRSILDDITAASSGKMMNLLVTLNDVLNTHVNTVTIRRYDDNMPFSLPTRVRNQHDQRYYLANTTYSDIIPFATRITCLLVPQLCALQRHHPSHGFCRGVPLSFHYNANGSIPDSIPPHNIRRVNFQIRKLHEESMFGYTDRRVYLYAALDGWVRWYPQKDNFVAHRYGWSIDCVRAEDVQGSARVFVWEKSEVEGAKGYFRKVSVKARQFGIKMLKQLLG
jgi:hypothetical protein